MRDLVLRLTAPDGLLAGMSHEIASALVMLVCGAVVVFGFVLPVAGITSWLERRVWARIQSRVGPNRVGPQGFLQWLADGIKNMLKEDIIPTAADRILFSIAPYFVVIGFIATFAAIPFSEVLVIADLNIGIVYVTAVTGLVVVGVLMAGWASNNKWSLLGGIRSAAQIVSYEIPAALSIFPVVLLTGTLSMQGIIAEQGWVPWRWFLFANPFTFVAFFVFFTAALAEGNRTPFDLPEAESELVAGFCTEYSGMRYLLFFLAEWGNLYVIGAIVTTLFLGGWQVPRFTDDPFLLAPVQFAVFFLKSYFFVFLAMWVRATLPRVRVDQLMTLCWKYLVPISLVNVVGTAVWMVAVPKSAARVVQLALLLMVAAATVHFFRRVRHHLQHARLKPADYHYSPII